MAHSEDPATQRPLETLPFTGEPLPEALAVEPVSFEPEVPLPRSMGLMPLRCMVLFS